MKRTRKLGLTQWEAQQLLLIVNFYAENCNEILAESPMAHFLLMLMPKLEALSK